MNAMIVNPVHKTCGACDLWGYVWNWALSGPGEYEVGDRVRLSMEGYYSNGYSFQDTVTAYGSSNPTVAGVSGDTIYCQYAGTANFTAISTTRFPKDPECREEGYLEANGEVKVLPKFLLGQGPQSCGDGGSAHFSVVVIGGNPNDSRFRWSFRAPEGAGNSPNVPFGEPTSNQTYAFCKWFAVPDTPCNVFESVSYEIFCDISYDNGRKTKQLTNRLSVNIPNVGGAVVIDTDMIKGEPEIAFDSNKGHYFVKGAGSLWRDVPRMYVLVEPSSQFFNKIQAHEEVHFQQWTTGIFASYLTIASLMKDLTPLTDTTLDGLINQTRHTAEVWFRSEQARWELEGGRFRAEDGAYAVSDLIPPQYAYQRCALGVDGK
jgi:hypothetical protein